MVCEGEIETHGLHVIYKRDHNRSATDADSVDGIDFEIPYDDNIFNAKMYRCEYPDNPTEATSRIMPSVCSRLL